MMTNQQSTGLNKRYLFVVLASTIFLPAISIFIEWFTNQDPSISFALAGKWFIFYAVGFRLLLAGVMQIANPSFTAKEIFHIQDTSAYAIVRELGFANVCFGLIGVISLFLPQWRIVSAFGSGLYYGIAALNHIIKKPVGANETLALVSDIFVFLILLIYTVMMF
ncbi:MAG: DUF6790 family protein [Bacteroidota bacterium]